MSDEKRREEDLKEHPRKVHLQWRDYVAVAIASLQTVLLPFLIFIVVLLALLFALKR